MKNFIYKNNITGGHENMAHLEKSLKLKELLYQRIKTEERSLPVLEKLKLAEECQRNVTSRDEYDHITKIVEELKKSMQPIGNSVTRQLLFLAKRTKPRQRK